MSRILSWLAVALLVVSGCTGRAAVPPLPKAQAVQAARKAPRPATSWRSLPRLGFAIQAGAFSRVENAAGLTERLQESGLNATYFVAEHGLYKVQFGNFPSREEARDRAALFQSLGVIDAYYIVNPGEYAAAKEGRYGRAYLRDQLVKTARSFIAVPYLWGGTSQATGFDCSGLTMAVYQLNGLELPRTSREQFDAGLPTDQPLLSKGDLVFFSAVRGGKVSHVGLYAGEGRFIHAPGKGRTIRVDRLSEAYYQDRYMGGRSYL